MTSPHIIFVLLPITSFYEQFHKLNRMVRSTQKVLYYKHQFVATTLWYSATLFEGH